MGKLHGIIDYYVNKQIKEEELKSLFVFTLDSECENDFLEVYPVHVITNDFKLYQKNSLLNG